MKILVIEDHPIDLKLAGRVLEAAGFAVNGIDAAEQAFASIKADRPDLILLDMGLPGMDGLALLKRLKADWETREILVVAVTAYPERFSQAKAVEAGCDGYLLKPISTRKLPEQLSDVAGRAKRDEQ
ncbi:MAG TPA: response regulator [Thermoanaerobaculia bacterium]|jgi:CheY-like chemotaxis protein|nr:response regulator [Thermoanaerobaculia bacterium]